MHICLYSCIQHCQDQLLVKLTGMLSMRKVSTKSCRPRLALMTAGGARIYGTKGPLALPSWGGRPLDVVFVVGQRGGHSEGRHMPLYSSSPSHGAPQKVPRASSVQPAATTSSTAWKPAQSMHSCTPLALASPQSLDAAVSHGEGENRLAVAGLGAAPATADGDTQMAEAAVSAAQQEKQQQQEPEAPAPALVPEEHSL